MSEVSFFKQTGEYAGVTLEPNDGESLFEHYSYRTHRGSFSNEMYVEDTIDGTITSRDVSLSSLAGIAQRELDLLRKQRTMRLAEEARPRCAAEQPSIPPRRGNVIRRPAR